jgi:hypothetical protein
MQRLHLKLSQEKKDAHREKDRHSKNAKCHIKTQEECAKCKKTNRDCFMRKQQTETLDQAAKWKKTNRDCIMRTQQTETLDQAAKCKKTKRVDIGLVEKPFQHACL